ncbi:MAG: tol-pal system YbgF family protein [Polyangiales bacterium]
MTARAQQSDARQRQAAAEAYDQGTAAYVAGDYEKAAEWFETANRMSPAAPALIQATRAHQQAGHNARAATLALRLTTEYGSEPSAQQVGQGVLDQLSGQLVRVDVSCNGCTLDVDGTLQERNSFFVDPGDEHTVTAGFETGERKSQMSGRAGETKTLSFTAPPPPPPREDGSTGGAVEAHAEGGKPLKPVFTFIGAGVTGALLIASIVSTIDMSSGVTPYETAANKYNQCVKNTPTKCETLYADAKSKLDSGQSKETRTTVFWIATGAAAAATTVIAALLTDWSGKSSANTPAEPELSLGIAPTDRGLAAAMKGRF